MLSETFKYSPETPSCIDSAIIPTCGGGYWNFTYQGKPLPLTVSCGNSTTDPYRLA